MFESPIALLLIEDQDAQAILIQEFLTDIEDIQWEITRIQRLSQAIEKLQQQTYDAILLDLALPDSFGLDTLLTIKKYAPLTPIIVSTVLNHREFALEAISQGAQDYLIKGQFDGDLLSRSINYAIERQRIQRELQQQIERERFMGRIIEQIRQSLDLNEILTTTVEEVRHFLNTDLVLIYRCEQGQKGTIVAQSLSSDHDSVRNSQIEATLDFIAQLSSQVETSFPSPSNHSPLDQWIESLINSLLTVPIWQHQDTQQSRLWGQLIAYDYGGTRRWQPSEVEFLNQLANQVAVTLRQAELYETVTRLANLDGLTSLVNRRQLDLTLQKEWGRLAREQKPLSLVMCDVDFFGRYNNALGYLAGDDCLKIIAQVLQEACQRAADVAARFGGEEFLLILPNTSQFGALRVAQNLQKLLAARSLPHPQSMVNEYVTLSIGVATQVPNLFQDPLSLLDKAAHAVQEAKHEGRNRIIVGS